MKFNLKKIFVLEVFFLIIATFYIPWGIFSEHYITAHTVPSPCAVASGSDAPPCRVEGFFAESMASMRDNYKKIEESTIFRFWNNLIEDTAKLSKPFFNSREMSSVEVVVGAIYTMILLNGVYFGGRQVLKKYRKT